ncbi:MAG: hypothetical protein IKX36_03255 [Prevotella sp.]|nr:hypothetical protein [Prevotella sp.]
MTDEQIPPKIYASLEEIRMRKSQLRKMLRNDSEQMKAKAQTLFHKDEKNANMPTQRFVGMVNKGAGFIDGIILVWKLYQKFHQPKQKSRKKKGKFSFFSKKRR